VQLGNRKYTINLNLFRSVSDKYDGPARLHQWRMRSTVREQHVSELVQRAQIFFTISSLAQADLFEAHAATD